MFFIAHAAIFDVRVNKHAMDFPIYFTHAKPVIVSANYKKGFQGHLM